MLAASIGTQGSDEEIIHPVRTSQIHDRLHRPGTPEWFQVGERAIQQLVGDLETIGVVETWLESEGRGCRAMYIETTFDPEWVYEAQATVAAGITETED